MNMVSTKNSPWYIDTSRIFQGVVTQAVFSFISTLSLSAILLVLIYDGISSLIENHTSLPENIDQYETEVKVASLISSVCLIGVLVGLIIYFIGLKKFLNIQKSDETYSSLHRVIIGIYLEIATIVVMIISPFIVAIFVHNNPEWNFTTLSICILALIWGIPLVANIMIMLAFKKISKEETWNTKAHEGARQLKDSYKYNIWLLVIPILFCVIFVLTMMCHMDSISNLINKTWEYGTENPMHELQSINSNYKTLYHFETVASFIIYIVIALMQAIYLLQGWTKVKTGGFKMSGETSLPQSINQNQESSYCNKCGCLLPDGSAFCPKCGTPVAHTSFEVINESEEPEEAVSLHNTADNKGDASFYNSEIGDSENLDDESDSNHRKALLKWGGIGLGIIVVALAVWLVWARGGKGEEGNVYVDYTTVFRTFDGNLGEDPLGDIQYGQSVTYYPDESGKEDKKWIKIRTEIDGKKIEGVVDSESIIPKEDFKKIDRAGLYNETVRFYADEPSYRRVIAEALKDKGDSWVLEVFENGSNPPNLNYIETYQESLSPSPLCFGFVIRDIASDEKEFFLYSIDNSGKGTLVHTEDVEKNCGKIESISLNNGIITVNYQKGGMSVLNLSNEKEMDNFKDFILLQGEIDSQYAIRMDFKEEEGRIRGNYRYLKNNVPITIEGTYNVGEDGKKNVLLEETVDGKVTGNFIGIYDGITFSGSWLSADGERELPFMLTVCDFE